MGAASSLVFKKVHIFLRITTRLLGRNYIEYYLVQITYVCCNNMKGRAQLELGYIHTPMNNAYKVICF